MPHRCLSAVLIAFCLSASLWAAEAPPQLLARVAVSSPETLLQRVDEFAVALTKDRKNRIPSGTLPMIATLGMPFSFGAFDSERAAQFLFFPDSSGGYGVVVLLSAEDFPALLEDMSERMNVEEVDAEGPFLSLHRAGRLALAELDGGRAAVYSSVSLMDEAGDLSWVPDYDGDSLMHIEIPLHPDNLRRLSASLDEAAREIDNGRDALKKALRDASIKEDMAEGILELARQYLPGIAGEIDRLDNLELLVDFDAERLTMRLDVPAAEGSALGDIAANLEKGDDVNVGLLDRVSAAASSAALTAPPARVLPVDAVSRIYGDVFGRLYPELRDEALSVLADTYAELTRDSVYAFFVGEDGGEISFNIYFPEDPAAMRDLTRKSFGLLDRMVAATVADEKLRFRFAGEPMDDADGFETYRIEFDDEDAAMELFERLNDKYDFGAGAAQIRDLRVIVGVRGDALAVISGVFTDDELASLGERLTGGGDAYVDSAGAKDALEWLDAAQAGFGMVSAGAFMPMLARQLVLAEEGMSGGGNKGMYARILEKAAPEFGDSDEVFAFSLGAADGRLTARVLLPTAALNAVLADYEVFNDATREVTEGADAEEEDGDGADNPYDYDEEDEDHEDEDMMLDGPAEAS